MSNSGRDSIIERVARVIAPIAWAAEGVADSRSHEATRRASLNVARSTVERVEDAGFVILPNQPVGWFNPHNDYHGYQQVAKEFEGQPRHIPLYGDPARIAAAEAHVDEDETA